MGNARKVRRAALREHGLLQSKPEAPMFTPRNGNCGSDVEELIPVMTALRMTRPECNAFQRAILGVLFGAWDDHANGSVYDDVDRLPQDHREAAYTYILRKLEQALEREM